MSLAITPFSHAIYNISPACVTVTRVDNNVLTVSGYIRAGEPSSAKAADASARLLRAMLTDASSG